MEQGRKESGQEKDIAEMLDEYIPAGNPRKWAKLSSTILDRRLHLAILKEILLELRKVNGKR